MLEINKIFVIPVDSNVGVGSPGSLNFLGSELVLGLELYLLLPLQVASPRPLNLDGSDVIHGKSVVLEKSPGQRHLVGSLDDRSTEISQALIFILVHDIER